MSLNQVSYQKIEDSIVITPKESMHDSYVFHFIENVLKILVSKSPRFLIIDLSHIDTVDSFMGRTLNELVKTAKLVGVTSSAIGLRPDVAITLIELGFSLGNLKTFRTLEQALQFNKEMKH